MNCGVSCLSHERRAEKICWTQSVLVWLVELSWPWYWMSSGGQKLWRNFSESFLIGFISGALRKCLIVAMLKPGKF